MKVRVTIARTVEEYTDVLVSDVESVAAAVAQIEDQLSTTPAVRARLLNKQTWMRGEVVSEISIVETKGDQ